MWFNVIVVTLLVILSGVFAGLTLALFSIPRTTLETKIKTGDKRAVRVYAMRKRGNLLLCTLLLGNVASYTVMAIFLGSITTGFVAGIVATALIFVFGEILPQAIFPRFALEIGSRLHWMIWILIVLFYPVSAPMAWILDHLLGEEPLVLWNRRELEEIIKIHREHGENIIDEDEKLILLGALSFSNKEAGKIMISREQVFYFRANSVLGEEVFHEIKHRGFSRIPVLDAEERRVIGILFTKNLIGVSPGIRAEEVCQSSNLLVVNENTKLDDLLNLIIHRRMQMAIVTNPAGEFTGIATLEDIMEEILKKEIEDKILK
jgi:metal transporter CNNM